MVSPIDADWSNDELSDTNLDSTTHGSGTTATRTGITSNWPANRPFFDTDEERWYSNTHVSAPTSVTWTVIGGEAEGKKFSLDGTPVNRDQLIFDSTDGDWKSKDGSSTLHNENTANQSTSSTSLINITNTNVTLSTNQKKFMAIISLDLSTGDTTNAFVEIHWDTTKIGGLHMKSTEILNNGLTYSCQGIGDCDGKVVRGKIRSTAGNITVAGTGTGLAQLDVIEVG